MTLEQISLVRKLVYAYEPDISNAEEYAKQLELKYSILELLKENK